MIDPRKNTEVYHEEVVEVYNRAFSKSFVDALLTQIRFQNSLHIFLHTNHPLGDSLILVFVNVVAAYLYHDRNKKPSRFGKIYELG